MHLTVAVCICTHNRPRQLARLLESLAKMDKAGLNGGAFIQIVDNAPGGEARGVYELHRSSLPMDVRFVEEHRQGISFARNRAIAEALRSNADFVAFIDDDDVPDPKWLRSLVQVQRETDAQMIFGLWEPPPRAFLPDWAAEVAPYQQPRVDQLNRFGLPIWAGTRNVLLRRDLLETMIAQEGQVFDPDFGLTGGGDVDFFVRALKRGARYAVAAESIVQVGWDPDRMTLRGMLRVAHRLGVARVMLDERHQMPSQFRKQRRLRVLSSPLVLIRLFRVPFLPPHRYSSAFVASLYGIAQRLGELRAFAGHRFHYYR
jgi:glycosyl transferase family 2